jgi:hypothetical protein
MHTQRKGSASHSKPVSSNVLIYLASRIHSLIYLVCTYLTARTMMTPLLSRSLCRRWLLTPPFSRSPPATEPSLPARIAPHRTASHASSGLPPWRAGGWMAELDLEEGRRDDRCLLPRMHVCTTRSPRHSCRYGVVLWYSVDRGEKRCALPYRTVPNNGKSADRADGMGFTCLRISPKTRDHSFAVRILFCHGA